MAAVDVSSGAMHPPKSNMINPRWIIRNKILCRLMALLLLYAMQFRSDLFASNLSSIIPMCALRYAALLRSAAIRARNFRKIILSSTLAHIEG